VKKWKDDTALKFQFGDAVVVHWIDIHNDEGGWKPATDVSVKPARMKSLGFWIGEFDGHYVISADIGDEDITNTRMFFPIGCVEKVKRVKNA